MTRLVLVLALLGVSLPGVTPAHPRVVVYPPPVYLPPPVHVAPPVRVLLPPPPPSPHRTLSRAFLGVGVPLLTLGFFTLVAGIPVTVLTYSERLCTPAPGRSCDGYYALSYGLLGGGAAAMATGIVFTALGRVFSVRARFAQLDVLAPRVALLPAAQGGIGGATVSLGVRF